MARTPDFSRAARAAILGCALALVACKNTGAIYPNEDAQGDDDGGSSSEPGASGSGSGGGSTSSSGSKGGSSGGSSGSKGSSSGANGSSGASSSGGCVPAASTPRVVSNISFTDAGVPLCGSAACDLTSNTCCVSATAQGSCISHSASCPSAGGFPQAQFECLQASDCPCGQVCCGIANESGGSGSAGSNCQDISAAGHCTPVASGSSATMGSAQLCQTDAECVNGMTCSWQVCNVQTPYGAAMPNLTMCGLQSAAPFNCSEHQ